MAKISPTILAHILHGEGRLPTPQQAEVTSADPGPMLVVAGAGAGKTETMASRVVWLVANGYASPEQVLGLTFTRKAAQELGRRIRDQFHTLAHSPKIRDLDPSGELTDKLLTEPPAVLTYDSYAGQLIREYGLLVPVEPDARLITQAELFSIAHRVVTDYTGPLATDSQPATVTENLLKFVTETDNELVDRAEIIERTEAFITTVEELPKGKSRAEGEMSAALTGWLEKQRLRLDYLPLIDELKQTLLAEGVVTFNEQMSVAARLVRDHPAVADSQRSRFRVVMLDEYQDTSHAQRVLLSHLYGSPARTDRGVDTSLTVTAVGDPMQAIYGWRGATVENLEEFVNDFPLPHEPAPKRQLTTSWRNPEEILAMANRVSDNVFFPEGKTGTDTRPVAELEPRSGAPAGQVSLAHYATRQEELEAVADLMEREFHAADGRDEPFTGAVLVRKNADSQPVAQILAERGIPYEIVGLGGLLTMPEVADLVALATMLICPGHSQAALRILTGPLVGLGLADLMALQARAHNLTGRSERVDLPDDPTERLKTQLAEITADPPEHVAGLGDAVADLGETDRYSAEGLRRLHELSAKLRHLRQYSLGKALPDLFADIEEVFDLRTEVLARPDSRRRGGAVHLDQFAHTVASFHGDTLSALLDYLELAREHEDGLEPGEVVVRDERVQILTAHKAKGLEWDVVAVVHVDEKTYQPRASTYLTNAHLIPDEQALERYADAGDRKDFEDGENEFLNGEKTKQAEETARLFYVAMTRTERVLSITASEKEPYGPFEDLRTAFPQYVTAWSLDETSDSGSDTGTQAPAETDTGKFPDVHVTEEVADGARRVNEAIVHTPALSSGETFDFWEREVDALIEEHDALSAPVVTVELPADLTATDMVNIKADPLQFARRQRRPVPFKPNTYAKRGTAFHQWLEDRFGGQSLLDEDQLPGLDEPEVDDRQVAELKEKFLASKWAERTPEYVEYPFEVAIGRTMVRGRMDSVFQQPDGSWLVVDWKTGQVPTGPARRAAEVQLAVYREAWRRIVGEDAVVEAAFHYVSADHTFAPHDLPDGDALTQLLASSVAADGD